MIKLNRSCNGFENGFTLIELMIAMLISTVIIMTIYSAYKMQRDVYEAQDQVTEVQQKLRAASLQITREARMAGYDPTEEAGAGITVATAGRFGFTQDLTGDDNESDGDTEDTNESITFGFSNTNDSDDDGIPDSGTAKPLGRNTGGGYKRIAEDIDSIEFYYILADGTKVLPTVATPLTSAQIEDIVAIEISLLARTRYTDRNFKNNMTYHPASYETVGTQWGPYNDHYRRRLLKTSVTLRNMRL